MRHQRSLLQVVTVFTSGWNGLYYRLDDTERATHRATTHNRRQSVGCARVITEEGARLKEETDTDLLVSMTATDALQLPKIQGEL
jgi:hypothetical protein